MKPQNLSSDPTAIHECTRMVGRLRRAFQATVAFHDDHVSGSLALETKASSTKEVTRLKRKVKVLIVLVDNELTIGKNHARNGKWVDITMRKGMTKKWSQKPKTGLRDSILDSKLPNFSTKRILVLESQAINESLETLRTFTVSETKQITPSVPTEVKDTEQESKLNELTKLVQMLIDGKRYIREPIWYLDNGFSRSMIGVKSYLHKYVEQPSPKLLHLNFKNINKLAKQNKVLGLPSLVYSKDKPCTICEKGSTIELHSKLNKTSSSGNVCIFFIWNCLDQERIHDIGYFHVFGCRVFIHNHKDHLGKFDAKANDGYSLVYSYVSNAFRVYSIRRQQIEETCHVTFNKSVEAIKFTNTLVDEIGIDDSSIYPPDEFQKDDPSREYQVDYDVSYYIIPHGRNNIEGPEPITEPLVPDVTQSHIPNQASTSSHPAPQDR
uniref:Retrovirus-related Pol polyprotein from transposon TNT 1-94 n=1 Tax=Tanacetum cinerariifolium TaxID=118510 RepID=A0A6L2JTY1_TANCI|nr:retrovirus-related Pol polyprotein from transposon TNT 1-94 [Tanacetum cinerariifolium]